MKKPLSAAVTTVAVTALAASTLLTTAGAAQAVDSGSITVTVVDQFGQPAPVALQAYDHVGNSYQDSDPAMPLVAPTHTFTALPGDGFSFQSIGPWSGVECFGVAPCVIGASGSFTPVVTIADGGQGTYTAHVTMPSVTGGSSVGSTLSIATSPGYQYMQGLAASQAHLDANHSQQWVRSPADVPGATGPGYTVLPADGGLPVAARLTASPAVAVVFGQAGYSIPPYTTRPVTIDQNKTKTKLSFAAGLLKVSVKSGPGAVPTGKVKLTIAQHTAKARLKKGKATLHLPKSLQPGTYTLKVSFLGSTGFARSKSKLTVTIH